MTKPPVDRFEPPTLPASASAIEFRTDRGVIYRLEDGKDLQATLAALGVAVWAGPGVLVCDRLGLCAAGLILSGPFGELIVSNETWRAAWARAGHGSTLRIWMHCTVGELLTVRLFGAVANSDRRKHYRGPGRRKGPRKHALDAAFLLHRYFGRSQREAVAEAVEWIADQHDHHFTRRDEVAIRKSLERAVAASRRLSKTLDALRPPRVAS